MTLIDKDVTGIIKSLIVGSSFTCWYLEGSDGTNYLFYPNPPTEWMVSGTSVRVEGKGNDDTTSYQGGALCFLNVFNATRRPAMEMTDYTISSASGCETGIQECRGTDLYACVGGVWQNQGCNPVCGGQCGGECTNGDTKCMSGRLYSCVNGTWTDQNTSCENPPPPVQNSSAALAIIAGAAILGAAYYILVHKKR